MASYDHNIKYDTPSKSYSHVELHQRVHSGRQQQRRQQQQQQQRWQKSLHSHNSVIFEARNLKFCMVVDILHIYAQEMWHVGGVAPRRCGTWGVWPLSKILKVP